MIRPVGEDGGRLLDEQGQQVEFTRSTNTFANVYGEMLLQICLEYPSLGDFRSLSAAEIRFFYNGVRNILKRRTK